LPVFSAMSLSAALRAASALANSLVCVWPAVPSRPNCTVKPDPFTSMAQNFCDVPSLK